MTDRVPPHRELPRWVFRAIPNPTQRYPGTAPSDLEALLIQLQIGDGKETLAMQSWPPPLSTTGRRQDGTSLENGRRAGQRNRPGRPANEPPLKMGDTGTAAGGFSRSAPSVGVLLCLALPIFRLRPCPEEEMLRPKGQTPYAQKSSAGPHPHCPGRCRHHHCGHRLRVLVAAPKLAVRAVHAQRTPRPAGSPRRMGASLLRRSYSD